VGTEAQVALREQGTDGELQADSDTGRQPCHRCARRIEPGDPCRHQGQFAEESQELPTELRQEA